MEIIVPSDDCFQCYFEEDEFCSLFKEIVYEFKKCERCKNQEEIVIEDY